MEDLSILGNAAAVPIVIFLTQLLKQNVSHKYASDLVALGLALVVCGGWEIYNIEPAVIQELSASFLAKFRFAVDLIITSFATWLAASKVYDLGHGKKKRAKKVADEKKVLEEKIVILENGNGHGEEDDEEDLKVPDELLDILEGR